MMRALELAATAGEAALSRAGALWPPVSQGAVLGERAHRPWPPPPTPWLMAQTWSDLLFAHWPVPAAALRPLVPEPLEVQTFDGTAWLGITPFEVSGVRLRGTTPLPRVSRFPELNVRTYTSFGGKPGIWFFSLDAGSSAAVAAARRSYRLPYHRADMTIARCGERIAYRSHRRSDGPPARLEADYAPDGAARAPVAGTLEHWLTERYCLYALDARRGLLRAEIHHPPWPLQPATGRFGANTMAPVDIAGEPLLHFARRQDVVIWPPRAAA
jgi:uncharacterized protein YqjF (DUF2071 family)